MIVYVERVSGLGSPVKGVYRNPQPGYAEEAIDDQSAAVLTFFSRRKPVPLLTIYNAIVALTNAQKTAVWADLTSGSPVKISQDVGANAGALFLMWRLASNASLPAAVVIDMKLTAAAYYAQDNPTYLVAPTFDATINIPGDQPA